MAIQIFLHILLVILGCILLIKSFQVLQILKKKKHPMFFLTRRQVKYSIISLFVFGILYIGLQLTTFLNGQWNMPVNLEKAIQYSNETFLIIVLIYLVFRFKKK